MNKTAVLALVLCSCVIACKERDTELHVDVWPRAVEPRLTEATWEPCRRAADSDPLITEAACGPANTVKEPCPELIKTYDATLHVLASQRQCTGDAITALKNFAREDSRAQRDLAAAYYLRAQRERRPSDFLLALKEARAAVAALPGDPAARFNLALVQETLGLRKQAIVSWREVARTDRDGWAAEARQHLEQLEIRDAAEQWPINRVQLAEALRINDREAVKRLIAAFPFLALQYLEDVVRRGDAAGAELLASELSPRLNGDPYALDVAKAMDLTLADRLAEAGRLSIAQPLRAETILRSLEQEARKRRYEYFVAKIQAQHAYVLFVRDQHLAAVREAETARETFARFRDAEMLGSLYRTTCGLYRDLGDNEQSLHDGILAVHNLPKVVNDRIKYMMLGELSETVAGIADPDAALLYQEAAVNMLRVSKTQDAASLGTALRWRGAIELQLHRYRDAKRDIEEAVQLLATSKDRPLVNIRTQEALGRWRLGLNPAQAIVAFTEALNLTPKDLHTQRAVLFAQRAEANRRAEQDADSERDLRSAIAELRLDERLQLVARERGEDEDLWSNFFSRAEETYDRLVAQLVRANRWVEAFDIDERSRAYEPLDLILKLDVTPDAFRKLVPEGEPMKLAAIRDQLPSGTFLLQYSIRDDGTDTWIVSRERATHITQPARRIDVKTWSEALQRPNDDQFMRASKSVYSELLARPLAQIAAMPGGDRPERLVIVPDGPMHGIPFAALYNVERRQYLIERAPIEVAGSATLYVFSLLRDAAMMSPEPSALLIGNPAIVESDLTRGLSKIPGSEREVGKIAAYYQPRAVVYVGHDATVSNFLAHARNKTIIHIGAHSIAYTRTPSSSVLLLADSPGRIGTITARELLSDLKLDQTRLVVLAACSSAGGLPVGPEGVAPLVRPLITAGVPAVAGTLWNVDDATAEALSVSFHAYYRQGRDAATALQLAQLDLLRNNHLTGQSLSWSSFQLIGHASSPFGERAQRLHGGTHLGLHRTNSLHRDDGVHPQ